MHIIYSRGNDHGEELWALHGVVLLGVWVDLGGKKRLYIMGAFDWDVVYQAIHENILWSLVACLSWTARILLKYVVDAIFQDIFPGGR